MDIINIDKDKYYTKNTGGRPSKKPDMHTLLELYKKYTSAEIADALDVQPSTVRKWVHDYKNGK